MAAAVSALRAAQAGVTLLEMLVVLGILAIVLGIGLPSLLRWQQKATVTSAVTQLSMDVARARSLSKRDSRATEVKVTGARVYEVDGQSRTLPGGVEFTVTGTAVAFQPPFGTVNLPTGATLPVTFTLKHTANAATLRNVKVVSLFGSTVAP